jgi:hypothetical protein
MSKKMLLKIVCLLWNLIPVAFFCEGGHRKDRRKVHGRELGEGVRERGF